MSNTPTPAQIKALRNAASRPRGTICPVVGVHAAAESNLIAALIRKGWAEDSNIPVITDAGRAVIQEE